VPVAGVGGAGPGLARLAWGGDDPGRRAAAARAAPPAPPPVTTRGGSTRPRPSRPPRSMRRREPAPACFSTISGTRPPLPPGSSHVRPLRPCPRRALGSGSQRSPLVNSGQPACPLSCPSSRQGAERGSFPSSRCPLSVRDVAAASGRWMSAADTASDSDVHETPPCPLADRGHGHSRPYASAAALTSGWVLRRARRPCPPSCGVVHP
jgi:hypothetical protein